MADQTASPRTDRARSKLDALRQFPFLKRLAEPALEQVLGGLVVHTVPPNVPLVRRGERVGGAYLVDRGSLRVYNITAGGRESTLYWVEPGESCILAMSCLFSAVRYPAWVASGDEETRFSVVPKDVYRNLFTTEPAVQRFTFDVLAERVFDLMSQLEDATSLSVEQRLASFLVRKCDDDGVVAISQERIAAHLGTAREVVSRSLRSFVSRGLVDTRRGSVTVLDPPALVELVED